MSFRSYSSWLRTRTMSSLSNVKCFNRSSSRIVRRSTNLPVTLKVKLRQLWLVKADKITNRRITKIWKLISKNISKKLQKRKNKRINNFTKRTKNFNQLSNSSRKSTCSLRKNWLCPPTLDCLKNQALNSMKNSLCNGMNRLQPLRTSSRNSLASTSS